MEITLEEAAFGSEKKVSLTKLETCKKCDGKGAEKESDIESCPSCGGAGIVKETRRTPFGMFATTTTCRNCNGAGKSIKKRCPDCHGNGRVEMPKEIKINVPAGIENGTRLRVAGEGEAGQQGTGSGDLYVVIHVKQHKFFERDGDDIYCEVPISFVTASLGGEIEVPTLKGKATLKIPSGTQTNTVMRMKGKGLPNIDGYGKGNQNVKVIVETPSKLSKKQKELISELGKSMGEKVMPSKSLLEKIFG